MGNGRCQLATPEVTITLLRKNVCILHTSRNGPRLPTYIVIIHLNIQNDTMGRNERRNCLFNGRLL